MVPKLSSSRSKTASNLETAGFACGWSARAEAVVYLMIVFGRFYIQQTYRKRPMK